MENRHFQINSEWNVIHYPEKPTGFGILIVGDDRHFVDEENWFWTQNEGKQMIIDQLKESGYTIFSSNLYGRNWGSEKAVELAQRLYQHVIRSEILNGKIHVLAEGMGALVALRLMEKMKGQIRSIVLLNPILSLRTHLEMEKEHKFFYKKLMRELAAAYELDAKTIEQDIFGMEGIIELDLETPIKIIHVLSGGKSYTQSKQFQKIIRNVEKVDPHYILPEKKLQLGKIFIRFFNNHEAIL